MRLARAPHASGSCRRDCHLPPPPPPPHPPPARPPLRRRSMVAEGNVGVAFGLVFAAGLCTTAGEPGRLLCLAPRAPLCAPLCAPRLVLCAVCCVLVPRARFETRPLPCVRTRPRAGAAIVFCASLAQPRLLAGSLGFAAGVMLCECCRCAGGELLRQGSATPSRKIMRAAATLQPFPCTPPHPCRRLIRRDLPAQERGRL